MTRLVLLVLSCVGLAVAAAQGPVVGTLDGRVVDDLGKPASGATVRISQAEAPYSSRTVTSDRDGRFTAVDLPAGPHSVRCEEPMHYQKLIGGSAPCPGNPPKVEVPDLGVVSVEVVMIRCAVLSGQVTGLPDRAVANQWIALVWPCPEGFVGQKLANTDAHGRFQFVVAESGKLTYGLEMGDRWFAPLVEVAVVRGGKHRVEFRLTRAGGISGWVVGPDGRSPVARAWISVTQGAYPFRGCSVAAAAKAVAAPGGSPDPWHPRPFNGSGWAGFGLRSDTDANGRFEIVRLPDGEYTVCAVGEAHSSSATQVNVSNGRTRTGLRLVLDKPLETRNRIEP